MTVRGAAAGGWQCWRWLCVRKATAMELRSARIRRLLLIFACAVFGYVVVYNSLLLDRRGASLSGELETGVIGVRVVSSAKVMKNRYR